STAPRQGISCGNRAEAERRLERVEQVQVLLEIARQQESLPYRLPGALSESLPEPLVLQQLDDSCRGLVDRRDEEAVDSVLDLMTDAADVPADDGSALPHRLGHGQPEALTQRFLDDDGRPTLQAVDQGRVVAVRQHQDALVS